jgi:predicted NACHT family NTPase/thioredoxin-like negative regulator of GroEL
MPIRQFEPHRAVEVIEPKYRSGYRIGGRLVLTAAHYLGEKGSVCKVREKESLGGKEGFGEKEAKVVWKAQALDVALIELPAGVTPVEAIALGKLPDDRTGESIWFKMCGYPRWGWKEGDQRPAASRLQVKGKIYLADTPPLVLRIHEYLNSEYLAERIIKEINKDSREPRSEWEGMSGAAVICDGLVVAVQKQHSRPMQPNHVAATPLWKVYADEQWRRLLEQHGINPEPEIARLSAVELSLEIRWHEVSAKLLEERRHLTTNPMNRQGDVAYKVEKVFVPLGFVERKKVPRRSEDVPPERGSELYQEGRSPQESASEATREADSEEAARKAESEQEEVTQTFEYEQFLEQVLDQGQNPNNIAIIGEPGAGKTTLLQQIGRWVLEKFPESMVIWVSLADLQGDTLETYLEARWLRRVIRQAGGAEASQADIGNFANQFNQGRVWLLLDGLDEMQGDGNPLSEIQRQIREGGWLQQARILLTCRVNQWDGNRNALDSFDVYRTLEFSYPQQVEQFVAQWLQPQGKADLGKVLCAALKEPGKERIQDLVKNPLRLMLLCFDWGLQKGRLPETQAELYQRFVERIYEWKAEEFPMTDKQRQALNRALAQLSKEAIDKEETRFRLRHDFVCKFLGKPDEPDSLFQIALQLGWLNRVGVDANNLTKRVYAFYHPTFEEYFAALDIDDWDFFLPRKHRNKPVKEKGVADHRHEPRAVMPGASFVIRQIHTLIQQRQDKLYRIFEPQWKQVFLLWMGREGGELESDPERKKQQIQDLKQKKEELIQALTTFEDGCGDFYKDRAFLLAAAGIAEFRKCPQADAIVDQLVQWIVDHEYWLKTEWAEFNYAGVIGGRDLATNAIRSTDRQRAIKSLVRSLDFTQDLFLDSKNSKIVEILGQIGVGNETAIKTIARVLESTVDFYNRQEAAKILNQIDPGNERAIRALVWALESTGCENTRLSIAKSLGQIDPGNKTAIEAVVRDINRTTYTRNKDTFESIVELLGQIGTGNKMEIEALVWVLRHTINDETHQKAVKSLVQIGTGNEIAIQALAKVLLSSSDYSNTRWSAAGILGQIGTGNKIAIQALVKILESDPDKADDGVRKMMAKILGQIGMGNETAIKALVRSENFEILCQIGVGNETAIEELVQVIKSTDCIYTFQKAAKTLSQIGVGNEAAIEALVQKLDSLTYDDALFLCITITAESLGQIDPGNERAIEALVRVLDSREEGYISVEKNYIRVRAFESLGQIGRGNKTAIEALVRDFKSPPLFLTDQQQQPIEKSLRQMWRNEIAIQELVQVLLDPKQDGNIRCKAAEILGGIGFGTGNETAIAALVQVLESTEDDDTCLRVLLDLSQGGKSRRQAAEILGQIGFGTGNKTAIAALVQVLESTGNENTRLSIAKSLGQIEPGNDAAIEELVQVLRDPDRNENARLEAAEILGQIGEGDETAIAALALELKSAKDKDSRLSMSISKSLCQIGTGNQKAILALVQVLQDAQDGHTRLQAAERLGYIGMGNQTAIDALVQALKSTQDWETVMRDRYTSRPSGWQKLDKDSSIVESLGRIGKGNKTAIEALVRVLASPEKKHIISFKIAEILGQAEVGNEIAIEALGQALNSTDKDYIRESIAEILVQIGAGSEKAIQAIDRALGSTKGSTRNRMVESLSKIGMGNKLAIDALERTLKYTEDEDNRLGIAKSLDEIDPGNETAIEALVQVLNSTKDENTHNRIAEVLSQIGTKNKTASHALVRLLRHSFSSKEAYQLMMKCAEALPYPEFYQAFHSSR